MQRVIIGYGGFAREVAGQMGLIDPIYFVDDKYWESGLNNLYKLSDFDPRIHSACVAIGDSRARSLVVSRLPENTLFYTMIHESAQLLGPDIEIGEGSIICAGTILTTNITIGKHCHLNLNTTIGHDCVIGDYFTTAPGVNVSGNNQIGNRVYIGTGSSTREKITISDDVVIGMQSGVIKNIINSGTWVGSPAKKL